MKKETVQHTVESRELARKIEYLKRKQQYARDRWLKLDVEINAKKHKMFDILRRFN